ncbi:MAG: heavy-metal-associated domain-containing protein [Propionibacteriaceae bacterium]|jgi:copper chaperone CopZ|nr:heavy-metal-associated domain-containing protein [Propionibacteriaceae bacterium]
METRYIVTGMTCQHCVAHVTEEVSAIDGVKSVDVVLEGPMTVVSDAPIDFAAISEAVAEAGDYKVSLA